MLFKIFNSKCNYKLRNVKLITQVQIDETDLYNMSDPPQFSLDFTCLITHYQWTNLAFPFSDHRF